MGDDAIDGTALADRLAAAIEGDEDERVSLSVVDRRSGIEPTADGAFAYAIDCTGGQLAEVFVHPDRIHVEFTSGVERAANGGERAGLRVRPKAVRPPRTLVFVESPGEIEAALDVLDAVAESVE
ncbi:hypothetical protein [Halosimplex sp. J119]